MNFSIACIKRHRRELNWTMKRKSYCQLVSHKNKLIRIKWCLSMINERETFHNVVFVDESNVELNATGRLSFYQTGSSLDRMPSRVSKPKHSYKVLLHASLNFFLYS